MIKRFKPDGVVPFPGILVCVGVALAGAIGSGYVLGFSAYKGFSLLLIFPLLMGLGAGGATLLGIKQGAVRNVAVAVMVAALAGVVSVVASHHLSYLMLRQDIVAGLLQAQGDEEGGPTTEEEALALFDGHLEEETGSVGFLGFLKLEAREGTSIERHGSTTTIGEDGTFVLWGLEALLALGLAIAVAYRQASQPYCARCNAWYQTASAGFLDGRMLDELKRMFDSGSLAKLNAAAIKLTAAHQPHILLTMKECTQCVQSEPVLSLETVKYDGKNREQKKFAGAWTAGRTVAHDAMATVKVA